MARRHAKKKYATTVEVGNYFPDLEIGLKNDYVYYSSLLMGTDERFQMNRIIGEQAESYLEDASLKLQPQKENHSGAADQAINFLHTAMINERRKEEAWLSELCEALDIDFPTNTQKIDYVEIIKILNEVQKGSQQALLQIQHEADRWINTDIERVLNSKKLQNHWESLAKNLERKSAKDGRDRTGAIAAARKTGEDLYWGTLGRSGRPTDKQQIKTIARVIGDIEKTANKFFTGSGRGFAASAEKLILPYVTEALTLQSSTGRFKMDPSIMQSLYKEVLIFIVEQIITDELSNVYVHDKTTDLTFLKASSKKRVDIVRQQIGKIGKDELIKNIQSISRKNSYMDSLEIPAMSEDQTELKKQISQGNDDVERIISRVIKSLATDENLQKKFKEEEKYNRKVTKDTPRFKNWLRERFQLNESFNKAAIQQAISDSVIQSYEYSEERTIKEAAEQYIKLQNSNIKGTAAYRPKGNPKADSILGYVHYNLEYDGSNLKKKKSQLQELADKLDQAEKEMDKLLRDVYDHEVDKQEDSLKKMEQYWIRRNASVEDYTRNAQTFEFIRKQQLQRLEELAKTIQEREARTKAILTKYNVMETVKDQTGLLDNFVEGTKLRERGIGFSGGAMGAKNNGLSVLDNILALGSKAHILDPETDAEWLRFALLNSGLGLLGNFNRYSLENYFSLFAAYLMFDDAQLMVADALAESAKEIGKKHSVQDIHLYIINGVYIPQSYILEELYKRMQEVRNGAILFDKRNLSEGTVRTQIYGYNVGSKYPGNTKEAWERESEQAKSTIKIKMYYMMSFSSLVKQLSDMMGKI